MGAQQLLVLSTQIIARAPRRHCACVRPISFTIHIADITAILFLFLLLLLLLRSYRDVITHQ